jgi:predicted HNH restriction endonuclease
LHEETELNRVAWLCAACHRFVHRVEPNEELARNWDTVEKLKGREDVKRFVGWMCTVRWKKR